MTDDVTVPDALTILRNRAIDNAELGKACVHDIGLIITCAKKHTKEDTCAHDLLKVAEYLSMHWEQMLHEQTEDSTT